jgi:hypothetical protein
MKTVNSKVIRAVNKRVRTVNVNIRPSIANNTVLPVKAVCIFASRELLESSAGMRDNIHPSTNQTKPVQTSTNQY